MFPVIQGFLKQIDKGTVPPELMESDGLAFYKNKYFLNNKSQLIKLLLHEFHDTPIAGHCRVHMMLAQISFSSIGSSCSKISISWEYVTHCVVCQQTKYNTQASMDYSKPYIF